MLVPQNILVPFTYVAFDPSGAIQGAAEKPYKALLVGQKLVAGTAPTGEIVQIVSAAQAANLFGSGSLLHSMAVAHFANNKTTPTFAYAFAEDGGWSAGSRQITVTGTASAAGTVHLYVAGTYIPVAVANGLNATQVAVAIRDAINASPGLPFTATGSASPITVTARNTGVWSQGARILLNYLPDQSTPAGLTIGAGDVTGAAGVPTLTALFTAMGEEQYDFVALPWKDSALLSALNTELADRWGPIRQNDGLAVLASAAAFSTVLSEANALNSPHLVLCSSAGSPSGAWAWAAAVCGLVAQFTPMDQARPHQTLEVVGVLPPKPGDSVTFAQAQALLGAGASVFRRGPGGEARVTRLVTTYKTAPSGEADKSYRDATTITTLSYLRWDFRRMMEQKFARSKLASDNAVIAPGQPIVTPKSAKAEAIGLFRSWEELGLVEDVDAFAGGLRVEIDTQEPTRLNFFLPPNLVNALVVKAVDIGFIL